MDYSNPWRKQEPVFYPLTTTQQGDTIGHVITRAMQGIQFQYDTLSKARQKSIATDISGIVELENLDGDIAVEIRRHGSNNWSYFLIGTKPHEPYFMAEQAAQITPLFTPNEVRFYCGDQTNGNTSTTLKKGTSKEKVDDEILKRVIPDSPENMTAFLTGQLMAYGMNRKRNTIVHILGDKEALWIAYMPTIEDIDANVDWRYIPDLASTEPHAALSRIESGLEILTGKRVPTGDWGVTVNDLTEHVQSYRTYPKQAI